ncbi:MAG TPA: hypothetical protein VLK53_12485 [Gaiellaceae bacterium]|nr:hypothetical protein [Gaiellaceae bacterium]
MEIKPEPTPEEREAILQALADLDSEEEQAEWWAAGVRDAVESDGTDPLGVGP